MPPRVRKPPRSSCSRCVRVKSPRSVLTSLAVRCYVEPSPAGGYFVRIRGEAAPVSRHDTEEEAEAAAAAYERGLARQDTVEHVLLSDGAEVLIRAVRPDDKPLFVAGFSDLSAASV